MNQPAAASLAQYRVECFVRSNLRSHDARPFSFNVDDAVVVVRAEDARSDAEGFVAEVHLQAEGMLIAEQRSHDVLTKVINILCYEMRVSGRIMEMTRTMPAGSGTICHCAVYGYEPLTRKLFMMDEQAQEVQRLVNSRIDEDLRRALYWLRWAYSTRTVPEAFLTLWMAVERLVGEKQVPSRCGVCHQPLQCEKHGEQLHSSVPKAETREFLERHGVAQVPALLKLRNPLVHGSLENSLAQRILMAAALAPIAKAVEDELRRRLGITSVVDVSPFRGAGDRRINAHCVYRTSQPDTPFPEDAPTYDEIREYTDDLRQGTQHEKIVGLSVWPPTW